MKSLVISIIIGMTVLLSGCAGVFLLGAGVGAGAFSYIAGDLTRVYEADYQQSIMAGSKVMNHNLNRKEETADELKTIIEGHLDDDTPVTIKVVYVEAGWTQIGVRTGYIGIDNLEKSKQMHADIAEELKKLKLSNLKDASQKKIKKPPNLQATSRKKVKLSESKSRKSRTLYDDLPFPPVSETASAPVESDIDDTQELRGRQKKQALPHPESNHKTFTYYPKSALTIHSGSYGGLYEVISYLDKNPSARVGIFEYTDSTGNIDRNFALSRKQVSEIHDYLIAHGVSEETVTTQVIKMTNSHDSNPAEGLESLIPRVEITIRPETVSASMKIDLDDTQEMRGRQEKQTLALTESGTKTFIYYPKYALTIHSVTYGILDNVISYLEKHPSARADIRDYTNFSGNIVNDIALSRKRVSEIRNYLISSDISEERITTQEMKMSNSLDSNPTEGLESLNPRVKITIR